MNSKNITAGELFSATKSFVGVRALVSVAVTLVMLIIGAAGVAICIVLLASNPTAALIATLVIFVLLFGIIRLAKRWFLYMIKAAHVSAITEYIKTGQAPSIDNGYQGVLAYGKDKVVNNFGAANIAFAADALIAGAAKQILKWLSKAGNLLAKIPGLNIIVQFVYLMLSTAINYIDEAVLSYVFYHDKEPNAFKKACDGLSFYAQGWKGIIKGAAKAALFIWAVRAAVVIIMIMVITAVIQTASPVVFVISVVAAFVLLFGIESILIDPFATCIMVNDYHKTVAANPVLKRDLHGTLCKVSRKFRNLSEKAGWPSTPPEDTPYTSTAY